MLKRTIGWVYILDVKKGTVSDRCSETIFGETVEELNKEEERILDEARKNGEIDDITWSEDKDAKWDEFLEEWE